MEGTYSPRRENSIDLMAVVLHVPVVTLNEAATSMVDVSYTNICRQIETHMNAAGVKVKIRDRSNQS